jgi:O-antigen/teichoic acid export membrane protein
VSAPTSSRSGVGRFEQGVLWNFGSIAILSVCGLLLLRVIPDLYDTGALGIFESVWVVYIFASQLGSGGIDRSALRALAERRDDPREIGRIVTGALLPAAVQAALVAAALYASRDFWAGLVELPEVADGIAYAVPGLFCFALNKVALGIVNGLQRMRAYAVYQSLRYLLMLAGPFVVHALGWPAARVAFLFTFAEVLLSLVLACELLLVIPRPRGGWLAWAPLHLRFGARSLVSGVLLELNTRLDVWMIGYFGLGKLQIAYYAVALHIAEGVFQLITVLQSNFNPVLARHIARGEHVELAAFVRRGKRFTWLLMGSIALVAVLGYPLGVGVLMGQPEYVEQGWWAFGWLMTGIALAAGYLPFQQILLMANRPGWHTVFMCATVVCNGVGNAILIPRYGIAGAAIATGSSFLASAVLIRVLAARFAGVRL